MAAITPKPKINRPLRSVNREKTNVNAPELLSGEDRLIGSALFEILGNNIKPAGINKKDKANAINRPITIIQPKSITGRMPLTTSDINATIVVNTV